MVKPITPGEVIVARKKMLPDDVIEVFNELITRAFNGRSALVSQREALTQIAARLNLSRDQVFMSGYLDVEAVFSEAGWIVKYEQPARDEAFEPYFEFSRPKG